MAARSPASAASSAVFWLSSWLVERLVLTETDTAATESMPSTNRESTATVIAKPSWRRSLAGVVVVSDRSVVMLESIRVIPC
ncbi:MAG TPA: hypothetical protein VFW38_05920 [Solirubrobacteraceae bacterium]|nr:hypothetical protein [Solirubrobacteraceae bacterium]